MRCTPLCSLGDVHPAGKPLIPVIYDHEADKYIGESTDIIKYIEVQLLLPATRETDAALAAALHAQVWKESECRLPLRTQRTLKLAHHCRRRSIRTLSWAHPTAPPTRESLRVHSFLRNLQSLADNSRSAKCRISSWSGSQTHRCACLLQGGGPVPGQVHGLSAGGGRRRAQGQGGAGRRVQEAGPGAGQGGWQQLHGSPFFALHSLF